MRTLTILDTFTDTETIKRQGMDIACIQSDVTVTVAIHGTINDAAGATLGVLQDDTPADKSIVLTAGQPQNVNLDVFAGLDQFKLVASGAVAEDVTILLGERDFRS